MMDTTGIGLVDLDTSHPQAWIPILRELGYHINGVFDGGTVYPNGYAQQFAQQHNIPHVFDSVEQMAIHPDIQIAIIHSCNWDLHVPRAAPFIDEGKAVLVDKPIAGNLADLCQFEQWIQAGARVTGGSSLRYSQEVVAYRTSVASKGEARTMLVGCGVDEFNYGIHAYSMAAGMMGPGMIAARHLGMRDSMHQVELRWQDGRQITVLIGGETWLPFYATTIHAREVQQIVVQVDGLYRALLEHVMPYLSGGTDQPPTPFDVLVEPEMAALAARASCHRHGEWVRLDQLPGIPGGYDGAAFGQAYRTAKLGH